jgi:hypothetical protein
MLGDFARFDIFPRVELLKGLWVRDPGRTVGSIRYVEGQKGITRMFLLDCPMSDEPTPHFPQVKICSHYS